jgi:hypothetical protein
MKSNRQRRLSGPFGARDLGHGAWALSDVPSGTEIYLKGAEPDAAQVLAAGRIDAVVLEWLHDGVGLALERGSKVARLRAGGAIVHQQSGQLFDGLPLASFDSDARRFWRRTFRLVRLPGGRYLLRFLARRSRGKR